MDNLSPKLTEEVVVQRRALLDPFFAGVESALVGQVHLVNRLMIGLLTDGHLLLEGLPGLAKTLAVRTVAQLLDLKFQRIQFTPDLLPADVIGTQIYNPRSGEFSVKPGPVFANLVLADEINRAPAKVQSALLEAMQERQVTIGENSLPLPNPFFVLATQNPIEQEGTYILPEAQVDRFMMRIRITYPSKNEELQVLDRVGRMDVAATIKPAIDLATLKLLRGTVDQIYVDERLKEYMVDIVRATRVSANDFADLSSGQTSKTIQNQSESKLKSVSQTTDELSTLIQTGASPRASIALYRAAKAHAFLEKRHFVLPSDIQSVAFEVLGHRIIPSFEAEAKEINSADLVKRILEMVKSP